MAQLIVRNLEEEVVEALEARAASRGQSAEAEHREILRAALVGPTAGPSFWEWLKRMPDGGEDADFERPHELPRDVDH